MILNIKGGNIVFIKTLLLFMPLTTFGQWSIQFNSGLNSVFFLNKKEGWAVGEKIYHTDDKGKTWNCIGQGPGNDIDFAGSSSAWIVGNNGKILYSPNGGSSWVSKKSLTKGNLKSVFLTSNNKGWIVGSKYTGKDGSNKKMGLIFHKKGVNDNWSLQKENVKEPLNSVYFVTQKIGWAVGKNGAIYHTDDGGKTWNPQISGTGKTLNSVHFENKKTGWVVGENSTILKTSNGGKEWSKAELEDLSGKYSISLEAVQFVNKYEGWAVGLNYVKNKGVSLHTENGGKSWNSEMVSDFGTNGFNDLHIIDKYNGFLAEENGGLLTRDTSSGGDNQNMSSYKKVMNDLSDNRGNKFMWAKSKGQSYFNSCHFENSKTGWVVGSEILFTEDGGDSWDIQSNEGGIDVHFTGTEHGCIVGGEGRILYTENGGEQWLEGKSNTSNSLLSVHFPNKQDGWAVGYKGSILHTDNGGKNWTPQISGTGKRLYSVHFVTADIGYAVGSGNNGKGIFLSTTNGGKSWGSKFMKFEIEDVFFINKNQGWIVGENGLIKYTNDGGKSWEIQNQKGPSWLNSLYAVKSKSGAVYGWAVGSSGTVLYTDNKGETWNRQKIYTKKSLDFVHFSDHLHGWIIESSIDGGSTVYKNENSGK